MTNPRATTCLSDADILTDTSLYRDSDVMRRLLRRIEQAATRPCGIMEVCGGQTFTLSRYRLEELLPPGLRMIHGPGCPVCVTPEYVIDAAIELSMRPEVTLCSFGDMMRVPGSESSLLRAKAAGADIRLLYTPLDAVRLALANPGREIVFLAIGFETTAPLYSLMLKKARQMRIANLSIITSLFTVPAAVKAIVADPESQVDALLAAGHVCAITGLEPYRRLACELKIPIVVTGFEPVDMLLGIAETVEMLDSGLTGVVNAYGRAVRDEGNPSARADVDEVFEPADTLWRGIGIIAGSGLKLRPAYEHYDALRRFNISCDTGHCRQGRCIAPRIMKGLASPADCPCFGSECRPDEPVGAPMVSAEGVCAAYYRYRRQ